MNLIPVGYKLDFLEVFILPPWTFNMIRKPTKVNNECSVMSHCLKFHGLQPIRLHTPFDFPCKNTGMGCYYLLQIFPTQGLIELRSPALQVDSLLAELSGKP